MTSDFWGFGGYQRPAEGFLSWQHLTFVTSLMVIMTILAVWLGRKYRNRSLKEKNRVLLWTALVLDGTEITKVLLKCTVGGDPMCWIYALPLFVCSVQMITIPVAALSRGRMKEAALDFLFIFGLIGAVLGTYAAGDSYSRWPVLSLDNVASGITHSSIGFAALYVMIARMVSMKRENIWITFAILLTFCLAAHIANMILGCNYMFMMSGAGTPYDILYNLVGGHKVLYPLGVVLVFVVFMAAFYRVYFHLHKREDAGVRRTFGSRRIYRVLHPQATA